MSSKQNTHCDDILLHTQNLCVLISEKLIKHSIPLTKRNQPIMEQPILQIVFEAIVHNMPFTCKETSLIKSVSKEFHQFTLHPLFRINVLKALCVKHGLPFGLIPILFNSYLNLVEFERILEVWNHLRTRKYGEKYGHLLRNSLSRVDEYHEKKTHNTLLVYKQLMILALQEIQLQTRAPTELDKYVLMWTSDFLKQVFEKKHGITTIGLVDIGCLEVIELSFKYQVDLFLFYELIVFTNFVDHDHKTICAAKHVIEFNQHMFLWLTVYKGLHGCEKPVVKWCVFLMEYIFNTFSMIGTEQIPDDLITTIIAKARHFASSEGESDEINALRHASFQVLGLLEA